MAHLYYSPFARLSTIGTLAVTAARWLTATVDHTASTLFDPLDRLVVTFVATVDRFFQIAFPPAPSPDLRFQDWLSELVTGRVLRSRVRAYEGRRLERMPDLLPTGLGLRLAA